MKLRSDITLVLEVKGEEDVRDRAKYQAARRWVTAVNNWGRFGEWIFDVTKEPWSIPEKLQAIAAVE